MPLRKESLQKKRNKDTLEGWAVVRVSVENEVKDGSPTQQLNMIKDWAKRQKEKTGKTYKITKYIVEDGKSGRYQNTHKRKEILHLAELVKMGGIDFIVQERLDRFSRDEVLNIQIMRDARKNGVEIHEVNYGQFNPNDRGQRMAWKFRNIEAGEYSEGVSENVARKHRSAMVFNGKDPSPCPILGLDPHPRYVGIYLPNREELKIFEDIARKFIEFGYSRKATIAYCNEKDYKTKVWWTKEKTRNGEIIPSQKMGGKPFDWNSLLALLGNPKLRGKNTFFDNWNQFPDKQDDNGHVEWEYKHFQEHGPFFSKEFFEEIDEGLEKQAYRSRDNEFLFSGILYAPDGSKYGGEAAKGGENPYYYNRKQNKRFSAKQIHQLVFSRLREMVEKSGLLEESIAHFEKHEELGLPNFKRRREAMERELGKLQKLVDDFSDSLRKLVSDQRGNLEEVINAMLEEKQSAMEEIKQLKVALDALEEEKMLFQRELRGGHKFKSFAKLLLDNLESIDPIERKNLVRKLIPRATIVLGEDGQNRLELFYNLEAKDVGGAPQEKGAKVIPLGGWRTRSGLFSQMVGVPPP